MSNSKMVLRVAQDMVKKAKADREGIIAEGRKDDWTRKELEKLRERYKADAEALARKAMQEASEEVGQAKAKFSKIRNRPSNHLKPIDGADKLYHQNRVEMFLDGLDADAAIKEYGYIAGTLADHEKDFLHIYEDALMARCKNPGTRELAQQEIFRFKSPEEKLALIGAKRAEKQLNSMQTIVEHFKFDVENVVLGKSDIPEYEYAALLDESGNTTKGNKTEGENQ